MINCIIIHIYTYLLYNVSSNKPDTFNHIIMSYINDINNNYTARSFFI